MRQLKGWKYRNWLWLVPIVPLVVVAGFVVWASNPLPAMPEAEAALVSDENVRVNLERWIAFEPAGETPSIGVVFYPGGRVEAEAYAPPMRKLAEFGYLAVIVPMPLNLAVFSPGAAEEVMAAYPAVIHWLIGGHSLGGAMAANFIHESPGQVAGLYLWAAYPATSDDLSVFLVDAQSLYGTLDGVADMERISSSENLLPVGTLFLPIEGGNHAQFGWYGDQPGDFTATISREEQQEIALNQLIQMLERVKK